MIILMKTKMEKINNEKKLKLLTMNELSKKNYSVKKKMTMNELSCKRCGYKWYSRKQKEKPKQCPSCKTYAWDKEKQKNANKTK